MAAPRIRLRRSATSGNIPTTNQIDLGEVAINTHDGKLFLKRDQNGTERVVDTTAFHETGEPNGHQDRTQSTISFSNATRVFSIAPVATRFDVWCKSIRFAFTSAQTTTIPNTTGLYYIYFDQDGVLQNKSSATDVVWESETPVAILFWNALTSVAPFVYDTRHGIVLDWATHEYLHKTRGAVVYKGFNILYDFEDQNGSLDQHAQIGMAGGTFFNEDLEITIVADATPANPFEQSLGDINNPGSIPVMYRSGQDTGTTPTTDGPWVIDTATTFPIKNVTNGRMVYNSSVTGTWSTTEITNNYYGVMYIVATSDPNNPIISLLGQDEYATFAEAKAASFQAYDFGNFIEPDQTPIRDLRVLYKLIYQTSDSYTNARKTRLVEYEDLRTSNFTALIGGREVVITDHGVLSGLADDDHAQYVHTSINRTISADHTIDTSGSIRFDGALLDNTGGGGTNNQVLISKDVSGVRTIEWSAVPSITETNILYVSKDGSDSNDGNSLRDPKLTIKSALAAATAGTVIKVQPGEYTENNPLVMPAQTSIVGTSLREVTVIPQNLNTDIFYVNNGCYISDLSFNSSSSSTGATVAFDPSDPPFINQSPYIQNCTNFITDSIGLDINGANAIGDIKSMVVDSYTQFNSNGTGAKISNEGYAQLVSLYTICNHKSVECLSGGGCDLTNSNSSFGNFGLLADGVSSLKYTGSVSATTTAGADTVRVDISTPQKTVSAATYVNTTGVLTVTTSNAHGFQVGMDVKLQNLTFSCTSPSGTGVFPSGNYGYVFRVLSTPSATQFTVNVGTSTIAHTYVSGGTAEINILRPYAGQVVYFDSLYYEVDKFVVTNSGSGYDSNNPPNITITNSPESWGITAQAVANISSTGIITSIEVTSSGRGYGVTPPTITISAPSSGTTATATAVLKPSYFIVESAFEVATDEYDVTFSNEVPIALTTGSVGYFFKQSRLLASGQSFQYIGSGTSINTALPQTGGIPIPGNEAVSKDGGLVIYTSTNESGNFNIGDGVSIDQATGTVSGQSYSQSLLAQVTPYIIALGG